MKPLADLREEVKFDLGDLAELIRNSRIDQWLNEGQDRLDIYEQKSAALTWNAAASTIGYPADFVRTETIILGSGVTLEDGREWGNNYAFNKPAVYSGTATILYWARYPQITGSADSKLTPIGDQAIVSWAIYRAFKWLTAGRADYRRFSTITQSNGVDVSELDAIAERHKADFDEARATLQERLESTAYFG